MFRLFHKRKGVLTILGLLILVGVLFSAIIPMELVMKQADTLYTQEVHDVEQFDTEKSLEKIKLYIYPNSENTSEIKAYVENKGDVSVDLVRFWINDNYHTLNTHLTSMANTELGTFPVTLLDGSYYSFKVVTRRGNVYESLSGSLLYSDGTWYTPELSISIFIINSQGQYYIGIKNSTDHYISEWYSGGIVHNDIIQSFEVEEAGIYKVIMKRKVSGKYRELEASPTNVEITWPEGPPIIYVYADGSNIKPE